MKRKVSILARSMILTLLLTLIFGSLVVHAEDEVRINFTKYTVNIGDEDNVLQLKMENLGDKKPRWVSYNVNVATVDQDGYVTPLRKGIAIISSGIGFPRKTCVVTVVDPSVELNKSTATIYRSDSGIASGNKVTLTAKVSGATRNAADIVWSSSDEEIAKVVKDARGRGVVTSADKEGEAVISAKVNGRIASCTVTVLNTALELNTNNMQLSTRGAGSSIRLVPTVVGPKRSVTWTSSDRKIATVSGGKVTGKKEGTVIVTAKANGEEAICTVTVKPGQISINRETELLYVTMDGTEVTATETKELKTNVTNGDAIEWTSSNENVVKVEGKNRGKAKITAKGVGKAVITATCNGKTDTCIVNVKKTDTYILEDDVYLKTRGAARTYTLDYHVEGRNKAVWTSSDTKVVSVSRGKLVGKKAGSATVTVRANDVEDKVRVTVADTPTISLDQKEYTLYTKGKGNTVTLKATIDGASKKATWYSNASNIATVDAKGKITAKSAGRALITATANDVTAKCWVNVKEPKIILDKNELILKPQEKVNLCEAASMEIIGESQAATYKSSDTKKVTVDKNGQLTAKATGTAEITIKANGVEATCNVTVSECDTHMWGEAEVVREATCEESGLSNRECSVCHGKEQAVTPPLGHSFGKWSVVSNPTEAEAGLEKQVCTRCNEENTRTIPAKNKGELASGYKLDWEDDFNGTELNRDIWNVELHDPGWVNEELQKYVDSDKNIYIKDGNLVIQAIKDETKDDKDPDKYTSGRINTQNHIDRMYGKFEVRAKVPSGKGFLPAFWMMPTDENYYGQWPKCGEIDVMEVLGDQTNKLHSTLHFGEPHTQKQGTYTLANGDFSEDFHVYACEWDPGEIRFYVDGNLFYTENDWFSQKPGFGKAAYPAPYDQPFYMILNLAVGGSWVGYPDETTEFGDNAQLVVDYVRVYKKDKYDTDVVKPDKEVQLRDPDKTGNYIINGDFAKTEKMPDGANWKLLLAGEGKATAAIKNKELQITTTNAGELNYSVQIVQADLPIEKDCKYKLSYDAYADEARTMITDISAPDRGYIRYLADTTVDLPTEKKHFEHEFNMKSDSDANGRVEFNLGNQGSTAKVYITNVRLEKVGAAEEDVKSILPDGNYVYNGSFDEGNENGRLRLAYWDWDIDKCKGASVSVTSDAKRELKVVVPETVSKPDDVVVYQESIAIKGGKTYVLSFDAYADKEKTIQTTIAGNTYASELTTEKQSYKYVLDPAAELDGSEIRFLLGTAGTTYIDNVCVREDKLILNGDFSSGMTGFEVYVNDGAKVSGYTVDSLIEENAFSIDITDTGKEDWYIQLKQNNIKLEEGKWYKIGFDAKSTLDRKIMYALQRDGSKHKTAEGKEDWTPYSGSQIIDLTEDYKTFSHTFKMTEGTDPETILSISMGAVGGTRIDAKHTVRIDNITLEETDSVEIPPVEEGKEMIANGDFSEGAAHWEKVVLETGEAEAEFTDGENGKATYEITNVGTEDWHIQLKHKEKLTLEKGAEYAVKFNIKSTEARTVKYAFMGTGDKWYGGEELVLTAGEIKEVNSQLKVTEDTSDQITFQISMGQIYDHWDKDLRKPIPTLPSTIEIDDISVKKIHGTGDTGDEETIEGNLIKNGNFAEGDANWVNSSYGDGEAEVSFENGKATYKITKVGTLDSHVQLKQEGLTLKAGATYTVKFDIKSTAARTVRFALLDPKNDYKWYGGQDEELKANEETKVEYEFTVGEDKAGNSLATSDTIAFQVSMGKIGDNTPISTIEIDNVSVVKVGGDTEDDPVAIGTELIENGDFSNGKGAWGDYIHTPAGAKAATAFEDGKARYEISHAGTEEWNVQLKQEGLKMEKGAKYKVTFEIGASIDRDVRLVFLGTGDTECAAEPISLTKDKVKSVSRVVSLNDEYTSRTLAFQISMGNYNKTEKSVTSLEPHAIEISNISVKKVADETTADEETETEREIAPPSEKEPEEQGAENLIKNGDFVNGEADWYGSYIHTADATVTKSFENGKARYEITNAGTADWNVQLKQADLNMEKGAKYKVNFKIGASIDRDVKLAFMGTGTKKGENDEIVSIDTWCGGATIHLDKDKLQSFSTIVDFGYEYQSGTVAFQLSMGNYKLNEDDSNSLTTLAPHAIEISDISVTRVEDGTAADAITAIDQVIAPPSTGTEEKNDTEETTPPENNSDDNASDNSGNAEEVQDDQNIENPDEISDDTADDEDADQETSDTQDDSGDAETSDDQSDSGSDDVSELSDDGNNEQTSEE